MLEIRPGIPADLDLLWPLVQRAVAQMNADNNPQWGEDYPTLAHYADDLARGGLFVATNEDKLLGGACINGEQPPEYAPLRWHDCNPAVVIHRLAVDPSAQRQGVGWRFFQYAEALARQRRASSLRTDTYIQNGPMQRLILSCGFHPVGQVYFGRQPTRPLPYPCYEKVLCAI